jgi:hypothetical protein
MKDLLQKDAGVSRQVVKEAIQGNPDAKFFISQVQQALMLIAMYEQIANSIKQTANRLSLKGLSDLAIDGNLVANRLIANAKLMRYSIAESIRGSWNDKGETAIPESKGVLQAKEIVKSPFRLKSTKDDIRAYYGDDARFFLPNISSDMEILEKKVLYTAKHSSPMMNEMVPNEILNHFGINQMRNHTSFFYSYFLRRMS